MNDCKHNWKESRFVARQAKRGEYMFTCARCNEYRYVVNTAGIGGSVVHTGAAQPITATQAGETTQAIQAQA